MMPPMDDMELAASSQNLVPQKKGWLKRRSGLEKVLLAMLGVCCGVFMIGGIVVTNSGSGQNDMYNSKSYQDDVCLTPECAIAAANIIENMDITADPCDDFYRFACGGWMDNNVIPDGRNKWGRFYELRGAVDDALKEIVTSTDNEGKPESVLKLRTLFNSCMNTDAIDEAGIPQSLLDLASADGQLGGWPAAAGTFDVNKFAEAQAAAISRGLGQDILLSMWVYLDDKDTSKNVIYIDQPSLGLPLSMYLDPESYADYITAYKTFMYDVAKVVSLHLQSGVTDDDIGSSVEAAFEFEKSLALIMTPDSDRRNSTAMYNPMTLAEIKTQYNYPYFDWDVYFQSLFNPLTNITVGDDERIIVVQPDFFAAILEFNNPGGMETTANYFNFRWWMSFAADLNQEMRDIAWKYQQATSGVEVQAPRWQTCLSKSVNAFGFAAAHEYVIANFEESAKEAADAMVENLRAAFKELVMETDWMDAETQVKAQEKADQMLQLIGYPDWLIDNNAVDQYFWDAVVDQDVYFEKMTSMNNWLAKQDILTLRDVPKRDIWLMHPAIVNAWYSPNHNTITFPAGILQPPFFGGDWPRYLNFGAIGMVIGHEITHGFDDQGRQYDGTGSQSPWWSEETIQNFAGEAQCFIDQYEGYNVPELEDMLGEDAHLNGKNTQGENIADNGGIRETYRAYIRSVESQGSEPRLPGLTQFTPEQMLFVSYAQVWCEIQTPESLLGQVLSDVHSPGRFRVIGPLGNSEDFQKEFSCSADANMNRPEKCKLW